MSDRILWRSFRLSGLTGGSDERVASRLRTPETAIVSEGDVVGGAGIVNGRGEICSRDIATGCELK